MFSYLNIRGLIPQTVPSKVPYVTDELISTSAAFFAMTETWLTNSHLAAELQIDGYSIFRQDRQRKKAKFGRSSGGVAVYVRDEYTVGVETLFQFTSGTIESLGIFVPVLNLVLVTTYRSPDATTKGKDAHYRSTNKEFSVYVKKLKSFLESLPSPTPTIVMMGDLNMPHANWTTGQCTAGASTDEQEMVTGLYGLTLDHFLTQVYDCPTHKAGNTIDLMFTNNSDLVHNIESFPSSVSDHLLMNTTTTLNTTPPSENEGTEAPPADEQKSFRSLNFFNESVDWQALTEELQRNNWGCLPSPPQQHKESKLLGSHHSPSKDPACSIASPRTFEASLTALWQSSKEN